ELVVVLKDGPDVEDQPEFDPILGARVLADEIAQPIGHASHASLRVERQGRIRASCDRGDRRAVGPLLSPRDRCQEAERHEGERAEERTHRHHSKEKGLVVISPIRPSRASRAPRATRAPVFKASIRLYRWVLLPEPTGASVILAAAGTAAA